jgi:putative glutamine amidotransferase
LTKRLVSVLYSDFHPFDGMDCVVDCVVASKPEELKEGDILILHGGSDIHPSLYGKKIGRSWVGEAPSKRDMIEWNMLQRAKEMGLPVIGICRGAQMLCAFAGGHLIQHVNSHASGFGLAHEILTADGQTLRVNSVHHQMMRPEGTAHKLMAWTPKPLSDEYWLEDEMVEVPNEPEFVHFTDVKGFAFQWHPEAMHRSAPASQYIMKYIQENL